MSEVNYRRNGNKYSSSGKCWGPPRAKPRAEAPGDAVKTKSRRERRALKKGKR